RDGALAAALNVMSGEVIALSQEIEVLIVRQVVEIHRGEAVVGNECADVHVFGGGDRVIFLGQREGRLSEAIVEKVRVRFRRTYTKVHDLFLAGGRAELPREAHE